MRRGAFGTFLACSTAVVALAMPAVGAAELPAEGPAAGFSIHASHGYTLRVAIEDGFGALTASKDEGPSHISVSYENFAARAGKGRFLLNLGKVGKVSVRFRPTGKAQRSRGSDPDCKGGTTIRREGVLEGTIRFRGEQGFASVDAKRVKADVEYTSPLVCHFRESRHEPHVHHPPAPAPVLTTFAAYSLRHSLNLEASAEEGEDDSRILVRTFEFRGGVSINREVETDGDPGVFSFDPALDSATLAPPAPFSGSATFERIDDHANRWEGTLAVDLPGLGPVPLTGRDYSWGLTHSRSGKVFE